MKRILTIVVAVSIALSMTACDALDKILQTNLFGAVGGVSGAEIARATTTELVELGKSESFYATLAGDAKTKEEVVRKVEDALAAADKPAEKQELAILAADIQLKTAGGDEVVNNIVAVLPSLIEQMSGSSTEPLDPVALLSSIMPTGIVDQAGTVTDATAFVAVINAFVEADKYYTTLGNSLIVTDGAYSDDAVNAGAIAQNAFVASVVNSIQPPSGSSYESKGHYLLALLKDPGTPAPTFPKPDTTTGSLSVLFIAAFGTNDLQALIPRTVE